MMLNNCLEHKLAFTTMLSSVRIFKSFISKIFLFLVQLQVYSQSIDACTSGEAALNVNKLREDVTIAVETEVISKVSKVGIIKSSPYRSNPKPAPYI